MRYAHLNRKSLLILRFCCNILLFIALPLLSKSQTDTLSHYPDYPLKVIGMDFQQLLKEKTGGNLIYGINTEGTFNKNISYKEYWFGWKDAIKTEYCLENEKISTLKLFFETNTVRSELIRSINSFLGEKGTTQKIAGSSMEYAMKWLKSGVLYSLQDFGSYMEMYISIARLQEVNAENLPNNALLLCELNMSANNQHSAKKIQLAGIQFDNTSMFFKEYFLIIQDLPDGKMIATSFPTKINGGYCPTMQLIDFTGDKFPEVLISSPTGGSGGIINCFVFDVSGQSPQITFSSDSKHQLDISGKFENNYTAIISVRQINKVYTLNLQQNKNIYDELKLFKNGRLLKSAAPWIGGYVKISAYDIDKDGIPELKGIQKINGIANFDAIATAVSYWKWKNQRWQLLKVEVAPIRKSNNKE